MQRRWFLVSPKPPIVRGPNVAVSFEVDAHEPLPAMWREGIEAAARSWADDIDQRALARSVLRYHRPAEGVDGVTSDE